MTTLVGYPSSVVIGRAAALVGNTFFARTYEATSLGKSVTGLERCPERVVDVCAPKCLLEAIFLLEKQRRLKLERRQVADSNVMAIARL